MSSGAGNLTSTSSSRKRRSEAMVAGTSQQQPSGSSNINSSVVVVDPFRQVEKREGASGGGAAVRLKVRVRRYHGVARWIWDANDDVCGICQAAFEGVAPGVKFPGEDCPVVWGKCGKRLRSEDFSSVFLSLLIASFLLTASLK